MRISSSPVQSFDRWQHGIASQFLTARREFKTGRARHRVREHACSLTENTNVDAPAIVESAEAPGLEIWRRRGTPGYKLAASLPLPAAHSATSVADFLGNYDMDGDGDAEILFGNQCIAMMAEGESAAHRSVPIAWKG